MTGYHPDMPKAERDVHEAADAGDPVAIEERDQAIDRDQIPHTGPGKDDTWCAAE